MSLGLLAGALLSSGCVARFRPLDDVLVITSRASEGSRYFDVLGQYADKAPGHAFEIDDDGLVEIAMTLTAPGCPVAGVLVKQVADAVADVAGVARSHVTLTWDPPWTKDRMSEAALLELGLL